MDIRMDELLHARRTAIQFLQEVHDQRESPAAVILVQEKGMRNVPALYHLVQGCHHFRIPVNGHALRSPTNWAKVVRYCLAAVSGNTSRHAMAWEM